MNRSDWFKLYGAYLASPVWKEKRRAVLSRCNGTCEVCRWPFRRAATQVHHTRKAYAHMRKHGFGSEPNRRDYLIGICETCHSSIHGRPVGGRLKSRASNRFTRAVSRFVARTIFP